MFDNTALFVLCFNWPEVCIAYVKWKDYSICRYEPWVYNDGMTTYVAGWNRKMLDPTAAAIIVVHCKYFFLCLWNKTRKIEKWIIIMN
jgi:hypothetical protein